MEALTVVQKKSKADAEKIALELLDKVGMSERKDFYRLNYRAGSNRGLELQGHLLLIQMLCYLMNRRPHLIRNW